MIGNVFLHNSNFIGNYVYFMYIYLVLHTSGVFGKGSYKYINLENAPEGVNTASCCYKVYVVVYRRWSVS